MNESSFLFTNVIASFQCPRCEACKNAREDHHEFEEFSGPAFALELHSFEEARMAKILMDVTYPTATDDDVVNVDNVELKMVNFSA